MADRTIMNAKDAVSASLAECFVTIGEPLQLHAGYQP